MRRAVRAEARKLLGNRAAWLVGALAPPAVAAVAVATADPSPGAVAASLALTAPIVLMPIAALVVTEEYRAPTVWQSFTAVPRRWKFLAAKAMLVAPLALVVTAAVALLATGILHLTAPGGLVLAADLAETALRCGVLGGLTAVLGVVVGALTRHGATAVAVLLVWAAVLERLLAGLPEIGPVLAPFLPLANLRYFTTGDNAGVGFLWDQNAGAAYVLALGAVLAVSAALATEGVQP